MDQVFSFLLTYHLPLRHFLLTFFLKEWTTWKNKSTQEQKKNDKNYKHQNKNRTHKQWYNEMTTLLTVHNGGAYNKERTDNAIDTN